MKRTAEWRLIDGVSDYRLERYLSRRSSWGAIYPESDSEALLAPPGSYSRNR